MRPVVDISEARSDHVGLDEDAVRLFWEHFAIFPWAEVPEGAHGFELGCGEGVWASLVAQRAGRLVAVEADPRCGAEAERHLAGLSSAEVFVGPLEAAPIDDGSMAFGYALDAVQTTDDPGRVLAACAAKLRPGAPFLTYLCYALDNRPAWYRALWRASDLLRSGIAQQPPAARELLATAVAAGAYWPAARLARRLERRGVDVERLPLSMYKDAGFSTMRAGAHERFAADSQARFRREEVEALMREAGFERVLISDGPPYWSVLGYRTG